MDHATRYCSVLCHEWSRRAIKDKAFFFEKMKQKTFDCEGVGDAGESEAKRAKVFCFFFSKKNMLAEWRSIKATELSVCRQEGPDCRSRRFVRVGNLARA
jgi:hypothetical protein